MVLDNKRVQEVGKDDDEELISLLEASERVFSHLYAPTLTHVRTPVLACVRAMYPHPPLAHPIPAANNPIMHIRQSSANPRFCILTLAATSHSMDSSEYFAVLHPLSILMDDRFQS
jgi:hypothetical protein